MPLKSRPPIPLQHRRLSPESLPSSLMLPVLLLIFPLVAPPGPPIRVQSLALTFTMTWALLQATQHRYRDPVLCLLVPILQVERSQPPLEIPPLVLLRKKDKGLDSQPNPPFPGKSSCLSMVLPLPSLFRMKKTQFLLEGSLSFSPQITAEGWLGQTLPSPLPFLICLVSTV